MSHRLSLRARAGLVPAGVALLLLAGCGGGEVTETPVQGAPADRPAVKTLSFPAHWLVERLAGDLVDAECILPAGADAPAWQPPAELVASLADADLIVANGAGFESWIETATLPEERLIRSASSLDLIETPGVTHSHGPGGEHVHGGIDPHTWSDPLAYLEQARNVADGLSLLIDESGQNAIQENLAALETDLEALDGEYREALAPLTDVDLAANHPSFNYLARRYGLDITSLEFDPDRAPTDAELDPWREWSEGRDAPILLWESEPSEEARASFEENTRHVIIDPLEQPGPSGSYDYMAQARSNIDDWASLASE